MCSTEHSPCSVSLPSSNRMDFSPYDALQTIAEPTHVHRIINMIMVGHPGRTPHYKLQLCRETPPPSKRDKTLRQNAQGYPPSAHWRAALAGHTTIFSCRPVSHLTRWSTVTKPKVNLNQLNSEEQLSAFCIHLFLNFYQSRIGNWEKKKVISCLNKRVRGTHVISLSTTQGFIKLAIEISLTAVNASYLHMSMHEAK